MNQPSTGVTPRATTYAAIALVAALLLGAVAGYALGRRYHAKRSGPGMGSEMTLLGVTRQSLVDTLQLTPAQRATVDSLLDDAGRRADSSVARLMTDVRALTAEARQRVRAALDDHQRVRFDSLLSRTTPLLPRTPVPPRRP